MLRGRLWLALAAAAALAGCGKKSSTNAAREVTGLAAVPASAEVVIGADVARVATSPLVTRAVDQLLARDQNLASEWDRLRASCTLDGKKIKSLVIAIGPKATPQPGSGPKLMVATGQLVETEIEACVRAMVGKGGGQLTAKPLGSRTLYQAKDGSIVLWFAFGSPDTVVFGTTEAFVTEALAGGPRVLDNPDMKHWISMADTRQPLWAAGKTDERVRTGLVKVLSGQVSAGPSAIVLEGDLGNGLKLAAKVVMASPADANALESFVKSNLGMMSMAAQAKSLGKIVDKVHVVADKDLVKLDVDLGVDEVNQLISMLDGGGAAAQDSPPAAGSGSATGP